MGLMKYLFCSFVFFIVLRSALAQQDSIRSRIVLPNGWSLKPVGRSLPLGDLPLNIIVSPTKRYIAVTNNGQSIQSIQLIDAVHDRILSEIVIPKSWLGLAFSADEKYLYASGGNDNLIVKYHIMNNMLTESDRIKLGEPWPVKISPAGLQVDERSNTLFVVTKEDNRLYMVNLITKKIESIPLPAEAYTCLLSKNKSELYISVWGAAQVLILEKKKKKVISRKPKSTMGVISTRVDSFFAFFTPGPFL